MVRKRTNIEKIFGELLKKNGFRFKREYRIDNYPVDFFIHEYNLSIQVDGAFHHGPCKSCRKEGAKLLPRQAFQSYRDQSCIAFHKYKKINIIRVCECLILEDLAKVERILYNSISKIKAGESIYHDRDEV